MKNEFIQKISNADYNKYSNNKKCLCCKCITTFCYCSCQCKCHQENLNLNNTNIINYDKLPNLNIDELRLKSLKEYTSNNITNDTKKILISSRSMNDLDNFNFNTNRINAYYSVKNYKSNLNKLENFYSNKSQEKHYLNNNKKIVIDTANIGDNFNINYRNKYDTMRNHYKTQSNFNNLKKYYQLNNDDKKNSDIDNNNNIKTHLEFNSLFSNFKTDETINKRKNFKIQNKLYNTFIKRENNFPSKTFNIGIDSNNNINNSENFNNLERKTIDIESYRLEKYKDNFEPNFINSGFNTEYNKAFRTLNFKNANINLNEKNIIFRNDYKSLTLDKYENSISSNFSSNLSLFNNYQNGADKQFINEPKIKDNNIRDNNINKGKNLFDSKYIDKLCNKYLSSLEVNKDNLIKEQNINIIDLQDANTKKIIESKIEKNDIKTQLGNKNNKSEIFESQDINTDNLNSEDKENDEIKSENEKLNGKGNSDENINNIINDYENLKKKYAPNRLFTGLQNNINNFNDKINIIKDNTNIKNKSDFSISQFNINIKGELSNNDDEINNLRNKLNEAKNKIEELSKLIMDYKNEINLLKGQTPKSKIESINNSKINTINNISTSNNNSNKTKIGKDSFIIKIPESLIKRRVNKDKIIKNDSSNEITNSNMRNKKKNEINTLLDLTNNTYRKIHLRNNSSNFNNISNISNTTNSNCLTNNNISNNNISNITNNDIYIKKITTSMKKKFRKSVSQKLRINKVSQKLYIKPVDSKRTSKLIYTIITQNDNIELLSFDIIKREFNTINFVDSDNFENDFKESCQNNNEDNNSIYLNIDKNNNFYIVTGKNSDKLYKYTSETNCLKKLCTFKNNHSNGCLLYIDNKIICLSGNHNKKVEVFSEKNNSITNLPEMNIERSKFSCCFIKNEYIFALFGYNFPTQQYLNTIEIYNLNEFQNYKYNDININDDEWRILSYKDNNSLNLFIKGLSCFNYFDEKIIFFGGFNGYKNEAVDCFYQLNLPENFNIDENKETIYIEPLGKKLNDIDKNGIYYFGNNSGTIFEVNRNNKFFVALDSNYFAHIFDINNLKHEIQYLN